MKEVFDFTDYKLYLAYYIAAQPGKGRGLRSQMARELGCRVAYISQVLNNDAHFNFEQGEVLNQFLKHGDDESEFFLLLLQLQRAGSLALRRRIRQQMQKVLDRRSVLKDRFAIKESLSPADQARYYSAWYFAAVHVLTTIPEFHGKSAIARELKLSEIKVGEILDFLLSVGLVKHERGRYVAGVIQIFLGTDSPFLNKHHSNWRLRAVDSLDRDVKELHLSTVVTISQKDVARIRELIIRSIEDARRAIKESGSEELHCLCVDFFKV